MERSTHLRSMFGTFIPLLVVVYGSTTIAESCAQTNETIIIMNWSQCSNKQLLN